jgi:aspartate ammonia-lyase
MTMPTGRLLKKKIIYTFFSIYYSHSSLFHVFFLYIFTNGGKSMKKENRDSFIGRVELFEDLCEEDRKGIAALCTEKTLSKGTGLFEENDPIKELILIISGSVQVYKKGADEKKRSVTIFSSEEFLNESVLIDQDRKQNASAEVYHDLRAFFIKVDALYEYFENNGRAAVKVYSRIGEIISRRMEHAGYRRENVSSLYRVRGTRQEKDLLGEKRVPSSAYYGIQTLRAMENFDISGVVGNFYPHMISSLALVKKAAAQANGDLGLIEQPVKDAIVQACDEIFHGMLHNHFIVDMIQGGAGTSVNMNANEVIANRAMEIMGHPRGNYNI